MKNILKNCDLLSQKNSIYFNNKTSHQSLGSGILTIFCYFLIVFFLFYFCIEVIQKKNSTSYFFKKFTPEVGTYYLNTTTIFHYVQLLDENDNIRIDNDSFIIFGTDEYIDKFIKNFSLEEIDHYYYGNCTKNDILGNESIINDDSIYNSYCIRGFWNATLKKNILTNDNNFIYPYLKYGSNSKKHKNIGYGVYIIKCQNVSYRKKLCKNQNEILNEINQLLRIKFTLIDNNFDITIYKKPVQSYLLEITNHLTGNTITCNNLNFVPVNILSNDGLIFNTEKLIESFRFDLNEKLSYDKNDVNSVLSSFYFIMGNKVEIYMRTYPKIQDALANIGGISKAILMFFFVINYLINDFTINKDINEHYFAIKKDDEQKRKLSKHLNQVNVIHKEKNNKNTSDDSKERSNDIILNDKNKKKTFYNNFTIVSNRPDFRLQICDSEFKNSILHEIKSSISKQNNSISFKKYLKTFYDKKSILSKRLILVRNLWKSKISEENIIYLSIQIDSINKNLFNYNQFSLMKNKDFSCLKNYSLN